MVNEIISLEHTYWSGCIIIIGLELGLTLGARKYERKKGGMNLDKKGLMRVISLKGLHVKNRQGIS
jgi:hypothetical protein